MEDALVTLANPEEEIDKPMKEKKVQLTKQQKKWRTEQITKWKEIEAKIGFMLSNTLARLAGLKQNVSSGWDGRHSISFFF